MQPLLPLVLVAILASIPVPASGCAVIGRDGDRIDIASESAFIVWDEANKTEHFIRRATFQSTAYDFGFLVPTPSLPEVAESDEEAFARLAEFTKPRVEHRTRAATLGCAFTAMKSAGEADFRYVGSSIQVLQNKRVGDHDVVSIKFDRAQGDVETGSADLAHWLVSNGYGFGNVLKDWLKPYARDGWVITAFRIVGDAVGEPATGIGATAKGYPRNSGRTMKAKPVRLSFQTERPFYPYREPSDQRDETAKNAGRSLKVFFVADRRFAGTLGDGSSWPGRTVWADKLQTGERTDASATAKLPADAGPRAWYLTEFDDRSSPRPGTDEVYFAPAADQSTVARPPTIIWSESNTPWYIGLAVCFGLPALVYAGLAVKGRMK